MQATPAFFTHAQNGTDRDMHNAILSGWKNVYHCMHHLLSAADCLQQVVFTGSEKQSARETSLLFHVQATSKVRACLFERAVFACSLKQLVFIVTEGQMLMWLAHEQ